MELKFISCGKAGGFSRLLTSTAKDASCRQESRSGRFFFPTASTVELFLWATYFTAVCATALVLLEMQPPRRGFYQTAECSCILGMSLKRNAVLGRFPQPGEGNSLSDKPAKETLRRRLQLKCKFRACDIKLYEHYVPIFSYCMFFFPCSMAALNEIWNNINL